MISIMSFTRFHLVILLMLEPNMLRSVNNSCSSFSCSLFSFSDIVFCFFFFFLLGSINYFFFFRTKLAYIYIHSLCIHITRLACASFHQVLMVYIPLSLNCSFPLLFYFFAVLFLKISDLFKYFFHKIGKKITVC